MDEAGEFYRSYGFRNIPEPLTELRTSNMTKLGLYSEDLGELEKDYEPRIFDAVLNELGWEVGEVDENELPEAFRKAFPVGKSGNRDLEVMISDQDGRWGLAVRGYDGPGRERGVGVLFQPDEDGNYNQVLQKKEVGVDWRVREINKAKMNEVINLLNLLKHTAKTSGK
jgi:hypothetical protein